MSCALNTLLDVTGTRTTLFILFHSATWELRHETELRTRQKLDKNFIFSFLVWQDNKYMRDKWEATEETM